jgi:hypothetical protein
VRLAAERLFLALALSLVFAAGVAQIRYGEIYSPHGLGRADSRFYALMARDFPGSVLDRRLDTYRVLRSLPSGIVYSALQRLGRPAATDFDVVRPFQIYNLALLLGLVVLWHGIANAVPLSLAGRWLGFLLLFGNWACSTFFFYLAPMTDCTALALGALLLYGYLRSSVPLVVLALAAGAFTWPPLLLPGGFMLMFPRRPLPVDQERSSWHWRAAAMIGLVYLIGLALALRYPVPPLLEAGFVHVHKTLLPISIPIALAQVVLGFGHWLRHPALFRPSTYRQALEPRRAAVFAAVVLAAYGVGNWYSSEAPSVNSPSVILLYVAAGPVLRPGQSLVAHAVFFGLTPLLLLLRWRAACEAAHRLGLGFVLFGTSLLALGLGSETRQLLHGFPALVLLAVVAVEHLRFPRWAPWLLTALAVFGSKVWLPINHEGFEAKSFPFSYPAQYYFMNFGPWMADEMFALQGSIALIGLLVLALILRRARILSPEESRQVWPSTRIVALVPLAALAALGTGVTIEWSARWWLSRAAARAREDFVSSPDPSLGWRNVPGRSARLRTGEYDVDFAVNRLGLRGPEPRVPKPAEGSRVLLVGGSLAEGYSVSEPVSVRARLEEALRGAGCREAEVLNAAVARYSTAQQVLFASSLADSLRPDAVVVFFNHQDLLETLRQTAATPGDEPGAPERVAHVPPWLRQPPRLVHRFKGSASLRLFSNLTAATWPGLYRTLGEWGVADYGPPPLELWPFGPRQEVDAAWKKSTDALTRMKAVLSATGGSLWVVDAPSRFEVDQGAWRRILGRHRMSERFWKQDRVARRLGVMSDRLGVTLVAPRPALKQAQDSAVPAYWGEAGTWNERGHAVVASELGPILAADLKCAQIRKAGGERNPEVRLQ